MFVLMTTKNDGPYLLITTLLVHRNRKNVPLALDGLDEKGLRLEKIGLLFLFPQV